jgi:hypothetical protein
MGRRCSEPIRFAWVLLLTVLAVASCGGKSTQDAGTLEGVGQQPRSDDNLVVPPTSAPAQAAIALPNAGLYGGVFLKVSDGPDFTCESIATVHRCAHWTVVVELAWELLRVGSTPIKTPPAPPSEGRPRVTASSTVYGAPDDSGDCDSLTISGTAGELTIDAIDESAIHGRFAELRAGSYPALALPTGTVEFRALRCP